MKKASKPAAPKLPAATAVRLDGEDWRLIRALQKKDGTKNVSDLLRRGLRALAAKEKIE